MSHFAKIENGIVTQVIVAEQDFINSGLVGDPSQWIQTSYNTLGGVHYGSDGQPDNGIALRGNYAGVGYTYDSANDVFYAPRPLDINGVACESWSISSPNWLWTAPTLPPVNDKRYAWNEISKIWTEL